MNCLLRNTQKKSEKQPPKDTTQIKVNKNHVHFIKYQMKKNYSCYFSLQNHKVSSFTTKNINAIKKLTFNFHLMIEIPNLEISIKWKWDEKKWVLDCTERLERKDYLILLGKSPKLLTYLKQGLYVTRNLKKKNLYLVDNFRDGLNETFPSQLCLFSA